MPRKILTLQSHHYSESEEDRDTSVILQGKLSRRLSL